jgi:hypothetical protein
LRTPTMPSLSLPDVVRMVASSRHGRSFLSSCVLARAGRAWCGRPSCRRARTARARQAASRASRGPIPARARWRRRAGAPRARGVRREQGARRVGEALRVPSAGPRRSRSPAGRPVYFFSKKKKKRACTFGAPRNREIDPDWQPCAPASCWVRAIARPSTPLMEGRLRRWSAPVKPMPGRSRRDYRGVHERAHERPASRFFLRRR